MTQAGDALPSPGEIEAGREQVARLGAALRRVMIGRDDTIDDVLAALLARGHVLLEGLPGLGKTELIKALSRALTLDFRRIQFTPDLLPTDITGSHILQERDGRKEFAFHPGPVFTNLLLADEINRASPKTQAALLEAMQERRVTTFGDTRPLPQPFFVLATQNPIELEGTYPLPEAQLDRFMFKVEITGVDPAVLEEILMTRVHGEPPVIAPVLSPADLDRLFATVDAVHMPRAVAAYIARLVAATHPHVEGAPEPVRSFVKYGSSPRGAIAIGAAARGLAIIRGKPNVGFDEVRRVAPPALAHRLVLDYTARLEGWDGRRVIAALLATLPDVERGLPETLGRADMRARRHVLSAMLAAVMLGVLPATDATAAGIYRTFEAQGLRISVDADWVTHTAPGYLPVRFDITNLTEARVIEIVERGTRYTNPMLRRTRAAPARSASGLMSVRREVALARGARVRFVLTVPVFASAENFQFEVRENGTLIEGLGYMGLQSSVPPDEAGSLLIASTSSPLAALAAGWVRPIRSTPGGGLAPGSAAALRAAGGAAPPLDLVVEPARVPESWLGFTSLRSVLLGPQEWQALTREQQAALRSWVACGGDLLMVDGAVPPAFRTGAPAAATTGTAVPFFLGHVHQVRSADVEAVGLEATLIALATLRDANWALPANRVSGWDSTGTRGFRQPIEGVGTVRARVYLTILLLFSLLIGPLNYLFLYRHRQQALIVVTAPLLSVLFIVVLAVYVVVGEGFGVHLRATTLTLLDQSQQAAATRASASLYAAGRTPGSGLRFSRDTAVFPLGGVGAVGDLHVDLSDTQQYTSGLVRARTPVNFETATFRTARERLVVTRSGTALQVVNGLGTTVHRLLVFAGDRPYALNTALAAGGRATLAPSETSTMVLDPLHPLVSRFDGMTTSRHPAGTYLAVLDQSPFWEAGTDRGAERDSLHLVLGLLEQVP